MTEGDPAERFMRRALELAEHGRGLTSPNPMVGAVVVLPEPFTPSSSTTAGW